MQNLQVLTLQSMGIHMHFTGMRPGFLLSIYLYQSTCQNVYVLGDGHWEDPDWLAGGLDLWAII
jgi:hypothetical protein